MSTLRLAIPSKGRLKEQAEAYFADAELRIRALGGARGYAARLEGVDGVDVQLLSASEIAAGVISGDIHVGVTGEDLLRESAVDLDAVAHLITPLGFGGARLVVAAPKSWIDVETMADVEDVGARFEARTGRPLRVATKYLRQTRRFFADKGVTHYQIVESAGATEGAPAAGAAELVVDITTSGATLESNGLKILSDGLILDSQAQLAASLSAQWTPEALGALRSLLDAVTARAAGRRSRLLSFAPDFDVSVLPGDVKGKLEIVAPGQAICPFGATHTVCRIIAQHGGAPVRAATLDFIHRADNPEFASFAARLATAGSGR